MGGSNTHETKAPDQKRTRNRKRESAKNAKREVTQVTCQHPTRSRHLNRLSAQCITYEGGARVWDKNPNGTDQKTTANTIAVYKQKQIRLHPKVAIYSPVQMARRGRIRPARNMHTERIAGSAIHLRCRTERLACFRHRPTTQPVSTSTQKPAKQRGITTLRSQQGSGGGKMECVCVTTRRACRNRTAW